MLRDFRQPLRDFRRTLTSFGNTLGSFNASLETLRFVAREIRKKDAKKRNTFNCFDVF